jgi:hypothetical protein
LRVWLVDESHQACVILLNFLLSFFLLRRFRLFIVIIEQVCILLLVTILAIVIPRSFVPLSLFLKLARHLLVAPDPKEAFAPSERLVRHDA